MKVLTDDQINALKSIVLTTTHANSPEVWALLERVKLEGNRPNSIIDLLESLRQVGLTPNFMHGCNQGRVLGFDRLFWEPFDGLLQSGELRNLVPGSLPRKGLAHVWNIITTELASDAFADFDPLIREASLKGDLKEARKLASKYREAVLELIVDEADYRLANLGDTEESNFILNRLRPLLFAEKLNNELWTGAQSPYGDMHERSIDHLTRCVRAQEARDVKVAIELLLLTMSTLEKPYHVLRVVKKMLPSADDRTIDTTPYGILGRRILGLIKQQSTFIKAASQNGIFSVQHLTRAIDRHNQLVHGLMRSDMLDALGPWQRDLTELCADTGEILESICDVAVESLERALPRETVKKSKVGILVLPRVTAKIATEAVQIARCHLEFLTATRLLAPLAAFGGFRDKANESCADYLDFTAEALAQLTLEGDSSAYLDDWVWATTLLIAALDGSQPAQNFERRIAASKLKIARAAKVPVLRGVGNV
jgi:hypothetical protein